MSKLWLWVNMMQLYNCLTVLKVDVPVNVLMIQQEYNSVIHLNLPDEVTKEVYDFIFFWREDSDQTDLSKRML